LDFFEESLGLFGDSAVANGDPGGSFKFGSLELRLAEVPVNSRSICIYLDLVRLICEHINAAHLFRRPQFR